MKRVKVYEATTKQLNWLVAKIEGLAMREPIRGTDAEAATKAVPFQMFETVTTLAGDEVEKVTVEQITVTRFGVLPNCSLPSITFADCKGRKANGSVSLFFFSKDEAELDCTAQTKGLFGPDYSPSTDWAQGGPIIDREGVQWCKLNGQVEAWSGFDYIEWRVNWESDARMPEGSGFGAGPTILIAAMRCYVASKLGEEIDIPEELT
jgi:hypothetical protein